MVTAGEAAISCRVPKQSFLPVIESSRRPILFGLSGTSGKKSRRGTHCELLAPFCVCFCLSRHEDVWSPLWGSRPAVRRWLLVVWMRLHPLALPDQTAHSRHPLWQCLCWSPLWFWHVVLNHLLAWFIARLRALLPLPCLHCSPLYLAPCLLMCCFPGLGSRQLCVLSSNL